MPTFPLSAVRHPAAAQTPARSGENLMRALLARAAVVLVGLSLSAAHALAQQRTITGRVTSEQGGSLPGVSVVIQGTRLGTLTNGEGDYSLRAETGQVLQFR